MRPKIEKWFGTSQLTRIKLLRVAGVVFLESLISQSFEFILRLTEGLLPLTLRFELLQNEGRQVVLLFFRELGRFLECLLQQLSHDEGDVIPERKTVIRTPGTTLQFRDLYR